MKSSENYVRALMRRIRRPARSRPCGSRGVTLMELLVVLAIIAIISTIAVPTIMNQFAKAKVRTAAVQVQQFGTILDMYRLDVGRYPSTTEGMEALMTAPPGVDRWAGPYLQNRAALTDPWGNPYEYRTPGDHGDYDLWSNGADGVSGGEERDADITNW